MVTLREPTPTGRELPPLPGEDVVKEPEEQVRVVAQKPLGVVRSVVEQERKVEEDFVLYGSQSREEDLCRLKRSLSH